MSSNFRSLIDFIWAIGDLLRDYYKKSDFNEVILPFTILKRLDCLLNDNNQIANSSNFKLCNLLNQPKDNLMPFFIYLHGFSDEIYDIFEKFRFKQQLEFLSEKKLLHLLIERFCDPIIDQTISRLSNHDMGYAFEELLRKFESSNENPGEHYTPREVIKLMVNLLITNFSNKNNKESNIRIYDPTCGSGGMLTTAKAFIQQNLTYGKNIELYGQEINDQTYAICKSEMLILGENIQNIKHGSSLSNDQFIDYRFDYIFSNPPYGKEWKQDEFFIKKEENLGMKGRFGAGLPRINDGQLLFLQHMISKMYGSDSDKTTRIAIVFNGSPLFLGEAGQGESEIRRWIIENDWLDAIIALPNQLFYNTSIFTYIWILTNKKEFQRKDKIILVNATNISVKMRKNLGNKRKKITNDQINRITSLYKYFKENEIVKIIPTNNIMYKRLRIINPDFIDYENVPLETDIEEFFQNEIKPFFPSAKIDINYKDQKTQKIGKIGCQINFNKFFPTIEIPRSISEINKDIEELHENKEDLFKKLRS